MKTPNRSPLTVEERKNIIHWRGGRKIRGSQKSGKQMEYNSGQRKFKALIAKMFGPLEGSEEGQVKKNPNPMVNRSRDFWCFQFED